LIISLILSSVLTTFGAQPVDNDCRLSSGRSNSVLMACRSEDGLHLWVVSADGRRTRVEDVDRVLPDAVPVGTFASSPSGEFAALEVALDEESGVLLVDMSDKPSVTLLDRPLIPMQIAAAGPQWHPSGEWLLFVTSGTGGDLAKEGVYGLRMKDRAIFRITAANTTTFALADDTLYVVRKAVEAKTSELVGVSFAGALKSAIQVVPSERSASRRRAEKE
jgi:hypothetical protein